MKLNPWDKDSAGHYVVAEFDNGYGGVERNVLATLNLEVTKYGLMGYPEDQELPERIKGKLEEAQRYAETVARLML